MDDDNYLHTGNLLKMLSRHPTTGGEQFYLGKKSRPFWEIFDGRLSYKISKKIRSGQNVNRNYWVIHNYIYEMKCFSNKFYGKFLKFDIL